MSETTTKEVDHKELESLIRRVEEAIEHGLALSSDDLTLLLEAIQTLAFVQVELTNKSVTLNKLKKLLGIITSSEKQPRGKGNKGSSNRKKGKSGKKPSTKKPIQEERHTHPTLHKGAACEKDQCNGKVYKHKPLVFVRFTGHAPFEAVKYVAERWECNLCGAIYTAPLPTEVLEDGDVHQKYGYSARGLMALSKFFSGQGYNHQDNLSDMMGHRISASSLFDQCEYLSNDAMPIYYKMRKDAAAADQFLGDDTSHRILDKKPEIRPNRNGKGERLRTGIYSSCIIAKTKEEKEIVLFETSLGHLGEFLDIILENRPPGLPHPSIMTDALSSNKPTICKVIVSLCNSHGRRQFKDIQALYPKEVEYVLKLYGKIWVNDHHTKHTGMTQQQRLEHHKEHSLPVMKTLKAWCEEQQAADDYEENGPLGKAIKYFLKHYPGLTEFCRTPGVPIDNNRTEETLKMVIRGRKNYYFFKTENGAGVANVLTSIIATAWRAGINVYEYLVHIQRYKEHVKANPAAWVPYRYEETLAELQEEAEKQAA